MSSHPLLQPSRRFRRLRAARSRARNALSDDLRARYDRELSDAVHSYVYHRPLSPASISALLDLGAVATSLDPLAIPPEKNLADLADFFEEREVEKEKALEAFQVLNNIIASPYASWGSLFHPHIDNTLPCLLHHLASKGHIEVDSISDRLCKGSEIQWRFLAFQTLRRMLWVMSMDENKLEFFRICTGFIQKLAVDWEKECTVHTVHKQLLLYLAAQSVHFQKTYLKRIEYNDYVKWARFPIWCLDTLFEADFAIGFSLHMNSCDFRTKVKFLNWISSTRAMRSEGRALVRHSAFRDWSLSDEVLRELCRRKERRILETTYEFDKKRIVARAPFALKYLKSNFVKGKKERLITFFENVLVNA